MLCYFFILTLFFSIHEKCKVAKIWRAETPQTPPPPVSTGLYVGVLFLSIDEIPLYRSLYQLRKYIIEGICIQIIFQPGLNPYAPFSFRFLLFSFFLEDMCSISNKLNTWFSFVFIFFLSYFVKASFLHFMKSN